MELFKHGLAPVRARELTCDTYLNTPICPSLDFCASVDQSLHTSRVDVGPVSDVSRAIEQRKLDLHSRKIKHDSLE